MSQLRTTHGSDGVARQKIVVDEDDVGLDQPLAAISAAFAFGTLTFLAMAVAPIILGALVEAGRLNNHTLGIVATAELLGIAVGSTVGPRIFNRGAFRSKTIAICLALAVFNLVCRGAPSAMWIGLWRTVCGLLEGGALAAAVVVLTYTRNPEQIYGYFMGISTIPLVIATYFLSSVAIPRYGANFGFWLLACTSILVAAASLGVSDTNVSPKACGDGRRRSWRRGEVLTLFTVVLQNAAVGAAFAYVVQIATQHRMSSDTVGLAIASLNAFGVLGPLAVGWIGWRLPPVAVLSIGCLVEAVIAVCLGVSNSRIVFLLVCSLFGACWNGLLPFSLKLLIQLDPSRRLGLLNAPGSLYGVGLGPIIAAMFVQERDVSPAYWIAATMFVASAALYVLVRPRRLVVM